jgi:hypothetical protein
MAGKVFFSVTMSLDGFVAPRGAHRAPGSAALDWLRSPGAVTVSAVRLAEVLEGGGDFGGPAPD